ncbi:MAG: M48 family metalloprotease, partial [Candidatus Omnitrophica bacterium]|nr:M48 family metalloprotease [Candidatus Omnitrophota bacterium]
IKNPFKNIRLFIRAVAVVTAFVFALTSTFPAFALEPGLSSGASAQEALGEPAFQRLDVEKLNLPADLGSIESRFSGSQPDQMVIYIQDAHASYDAQRNIQRIIDHLQKNHGLSLVAFEGIEGELDPFLLRAFPEREVLKDVLDSYVRRGELSGIDLAAAVNEKESRYAGLENRNIYDAGIALFLDAQKALPVAEHALNRIEDEIAEAQRRSYSTELREIAEKVRDFEYERIDLANLVTFLAKHSAPPNNSEIEKMVYQISSPPRKRGSGNSHDVVEMFTVVTPAPAKRHLAGAGATSLSFDPIQLWRDVRTWSRLIKEKHFRTDLDRKLDDMEEKIRFLKELARLQLTPEEFQQYLADKSAYEPEAIQEFLRSIGVKSNIAFDVSKAVLFYRNAFVRDQILSDRLITLTTGKKYPVAAFVSGGFHTPGITERLRKEGISYIVVQPAMKDFNGQSRYLDVLQGNISYRDKFERNAKGEINLYKAFARDVTGRLVQKLAVSDLPNIELKRWRDEIIRRRVERGKAADAYRYTYFIDQFVERMRNRNTGLKTKEELINGIGKLLRGFSGAYQNIYKGKALSEFQNLMDEAKQLHENGTLNFNSFGRLFSKSAGVSQIVGHTHALFDGFVSLEGRASDEWLTELPVAAGKEFVPAGFGLEAQVAELATTEFVDLGEREYFQERFEIFTDDVTDQLMWKTPDGQISPIDLSLEKPQLRLQRERDLSLDELLKGDAAASEKFIRALFSDIYRGDGKIRGRSAVYKTIEMTQEYVHKLFRRSPDGEMADTVTQMLDGVSVRSETGEIVLQKHPTLIAVDEAIANAIQVLIHRAIEDPGFRGGLMIRAYEDREKELIVEIVDDGTGILFSLREKLGREEFSWRPEGSPLGKGLGKGLSRHYRDALNTNVRAIEIHTRSSEKAVGKGAGEMAVPDLEESVLLVNRPGDTAPAQVWQKSDRRDRGTLVRFVIEPIQNDGLQSTSGFGVRRKGQSADAELQDASLFEQFRTEEVPRLAAELYDKTREEDGIYFWRSSAMLGLADEYSKYWRDLIAERMKSFGINGMIRERISAVQELVVDAVIDRYRSQRLPELIRREIETFLRTREEQEAGPSPFDEEQFQKIVSAVFRVVIRDLPLKKDVEPAVQGNHGLWIYDLVDKAVHSKLREKGFGAKSQLYEHHNLARTFSGRLETVHRYVVNRLLSPETKRIVDFGAGFYRENLLPVTTMELRDRLNKSGRSDIEVHVLDQVEPQYVVLDSPQGDIFIFDRTKRFVAHKYRGEDDVRIVVKDDRPGFIKQYRIARARKQLELSLSGKPFSRHFRVLSDPLSPLKEKGITFQTTRGFEIPFELGERDIVLAFNVFENVSRDRAQRELDGIAQSMKSGVLVHGYSNGNILAARARFSFKVEQVAHGKRIPLTYIIEDFRYLAEMHERPELTELDDQAIPWQLGETPGSVKELIGYGFDVHDLTSENLGYEIGYQRGEVRALRSGLIRQDSSRDVSGFGSEMAEFPDERQLGEVLTHPREPLLKRDPGVFWRSGGFTTPGAFRLDGKVYLVVRGIDEHGVSRLGLAVSEDGFTVEKKNIFPAPIFEPLVGEGERGVENARITVIDGKIYMLYTARGGPAEFKIALASMPVDDFREALRDGNWVKRWTRHKIELNGRWDSNDRNAAIFPEKIDGKFAMYFRDLKPKTSQRVIRLALADQPEGPWEAADSDRMVLTPSLLEKNLKEKPGKPVIWVGVGGPPMKTKDGWLTFFHYVDEDHVYRIGFYMADILDPLKILYLHDRPIWQLSDDDYDIVEPNELHAVPRGRALKILARRLFKRGSTSGFFSLADAATFRQMAGHQVPAGDRYTMHVSGAVPEFDTKIINPGDRVLLYGGVFNTRTGLGIFEYPELGDIIAGGQGLAEPEKTSLSDKKILVIEDTKEIRDAIVKALREIGKVDPKFGGQIVAPETYEQLNEILQLAQMGRASFDAAIIDHHIRDLKYPNMNFGFLVLKYLSSFNGYGPRATIYYTSAQALSGETRANLLGVRWIRKARSGTGLDWIVNPEKLVRQDLPAMLAAKGRILESRRVVPRERIVEDARRILGVGIGDIRRKIRDIGDPVPLQAIWQIKYPDRNLQEGFVDRPFGGGIVLVYAERPVTQNTAFHDGEQVKFAHENDAVRTGEFRNGKFEFAAADRDAFHGLYFGEHVTELIRASEPPAPAPAGFGARAKVSSEEQLEIEKWAARTMIEIDGVIQSDDPAFLDFEVRIKNIFENLLRTAQMEGSESFDLVFIDHPEPNAFVYAGARKVMFTRGLITELKRYENQMGAAITEDLVAFILAHELNHYLLKKDKPFEPLVRGEERQENPLTLSFWDRESAFIHLLNYREEYLADSHALRLMDNAGYNVNEAVRAARFTKFMQDKVFNERLAEIPLASRTPDEEIRILEDMRHEKLRQAYIPSIVDTHPRTLNRVQQIYFNTLNRRYRSENKAPAPLAIPDLGSSTGARRTFRQEMFDDLQKSAISKFIKRAATVKQVEDLALLYFLMELSGHTPVHERVQGEMEAPGTSQLEVPYIGPPDSIPYYLMVAEYLGLYLPIMRDLEGYLEGAEVDEIARDHAALAGRHRESLGPGEDEENVEEVLDRIERGFRKRITEIRRFLDERLFRETFSSRGGRSHFRRLYTPWGRWNKIQETGKLASSRFLQKPFLDEAYKEVLKRGEELFEKENPKVKGAQKNMMLWLLFNSYYPTLDGLKLLKAIEQGLKKPEDLLYVLQNLPAKQYDDEELATAFVGHGGFAYHEMLAHFFMPRMFQALIKNKAFPQAGALVDFFEDLAKSVSYLKAFRGYDIDTKETFGLYDDAMRAIFSIVLGSLKNREALEAFAEVWQRATYIDDESLDQKELAQLLNKRNMLSSDIERDIQLASQLVRGRALTNDLAQALLEHHGTSEAHFLKVIPLIAEAKDFMSPIEQFIFSTPDWKARNFKEKLERLTELNLILPGEVYLKLFDENPPDVDLFLESMKVFDRYPNSHPSYSDLEDIKRALGKKAISYFEKERGWHGSEAHFNIVGATVADSEKKAKLLMEMVGRAGGEPKHFAWAVTAIRTGVEYLNVGGGAMWRGAAETDKGIQEFRKRKRDPGYHRTHRIELKEPTELQEAIYAERFKKKLEIGRAGFEKAKSEASYAALKIQEKIELLESLFPDRSGERDEVLRAILSESKDELEEMELEALYDLERKLISLIANPVWRVQKGVEVIERLEKERPDLFENFDRHLETLKSIFPDFSLERDRRLAHLVDAHESTYAETKAASVYFLEGNEEYSTEDAIVFGTAGMETFRDYMQVLSPEDKKDILLWLLDLKTKPEAVDIMEQVTGYRAASIRKAARAAGPDENRIFLQEALLGENGIFSSGGPETMQDLVDHLFLVIFPDDAGIEPAARQRLKALFDAAFRLSTPKRRSDLLIALSNARNKDLSMAGMIRVFLQAYGSMGVKVGQYLAVRTHLLQPDVRKELLKLTDEAEPFLKIRAYESIQVDFAVQNPEEIFPTVGKRIGGASFKQAYAGKIKDGADHPGVAIKIIRPTALKEIESDLDTFEKLFDFVNANASFFGFRFPPGMGKEIRRRTLEEMNFEKEREKQERIRQSVEKRWEGRHKDGYHVEVPPVFSNYTKPSVFVDKLAPGLAIKNWEELSKRHDMARVSEIIVREYLEQILLDGFYQADPHPGNIFVSGDRAISMIDFGITGSLSALHRDQLFDLIDAVGRRDRDRLIDLALEFYEEMEEKERPVVPLPQIETAIDKILATPMRPEKMGHFIYDVLDQINETGIRLPDEFFTLITALSAMDYLIASMKNPAAFFFAELMRLKGSHLEYKAAHPIQRVSRARLDELRTRLAKEVRAKVEPIKAALREKKEEKPLGVMREIWKKDKLARGDKLRFKHRREEIWQASWQAGLRTNAHIVVERKSDRTTSVSPEFLKRRVESILSDRVFPRLPTFEYGDEGFQSDGELAYFTEYIDEMSFSGHPVLKKLADKVDDISKKIHDREEEETDEGEETGEEIEDDYRPWEEDERFREDYIKRRAKDRDESVWLTEEEEEEEFEGKDFEALEMLRAFFNELDDFDSKRLAAEFVKGKEAFEKYLFERLGIRESDIKEIYDEIIAEADPAQIEMMEIILTEDTVPRLEIEEEDEWYDLSAYQLTRGINARGFGSIDDGQNISFGVSAGERYLVKPIDEKISGVQTTTVGFGPARSEFPDEQRLDGGTGFGALEKELAVRLKSHPEKRVRLEVLVELAEMHLSREHNAALFYALSDPDAEIRELASFNLGGQGAASLEEIIAHIENPEAPQNSDPRLPKYEKFDAAVSRRNARAAGIMALEWIVDREAALAKRIRASITRQAGKWLKEERIELVGLEAKDALGSTAHMPLFYVLRLLIRWYQEENRAGLGAAFEGDLELPLSWAFRAVRKIYPNMSSGVGRSVIYERISRLADYPSTAAVPPPVVTYDGVRRKSSHVSAGIPPIVRLRGKNHPAEPAGFGADQQISVSYASNVARILKLDEAKIRQVLEQIRSDGFQSVRARLEREWIEALDKSLMIRRDLHSLAVEIAETGQTRTAEYLAGFLVRELNLSGYAEDPALLGQFTLLLNRLRFMLERYRYGQLTDKLRHYVLSDEEKAKIAARIDALRFTNETLFEKAGHKISDEIDAVLSNFRGGDMGPVAYERETVPLDIDALAGLGRIHYFHPPGERGILDSIQVLLRSARGEKLARLSGILGGIQEHTYYRAITPAELRRNLPDAGSVLIVPSPVKLFGESTQAFHTQNVIVYAGRSFDETQPALRVLASKVDQAARVLSQISSGDREALLRQLEDYGFSIQTDGGGGQFIFVDRNAFLTKLEETFAALTQTAIAA